MLPAHLAQCENCGTDATMRCAGCMNAPQYHPDDSTAIVYCGRDCQRGDWPSHKLHCRTMKQRRKLYRAASMLKEALLTYREAVYDIDLTRIDYQDGALHLYQNQRSVTALAKRGPFPNHLTDNIEHREAALTINQCTTAMALLGRLTRKLLAGVASTVEILDLEIGKPLVPVKLIPGPDSTKCPHTVIKVGRLRSDERWIIDTAGCQFGFRDVLVPFENYLEINGCRILSGPGTYDATETKDLDYFATLPFMNRTKAQRENHRLERRTRLRFADFVDSRIGADVLDGSDAEFTNKLENLTTELKSHMLSYAAR